MTYATVFDVATTLGRPITDPDEQNQILNWIAKTERIISARLGDLDALDRQILADVISEVVARRSRNPDGKRNERIDDYSYTLDAAASAVELTLTDAEWARLSQDGSTSGAYMPVLAPAPWLGGRDADTTPTGGWA
nr:MAG TPA: hypothetical protein [Caudoviricetes sp.]